MVCAPTATSRTPPTRSLPANWVQLVSVGRLPPSRIKPSFSESGTTNRKLCVNCLPEPEVLQRLYITRYIIYTDLGFRRILQLIKTCYMLIPTERVVIFDG